MPELAVLLIVLAIATGWMYNRLVRDRNTVQAAWSDIDVQLKRRHELVPRLVECVRAYADFERATLIAVTELRQRSMETPQLPRKAAIEDTMEAALHQLFLRAEGYPDLKADGNFSQLQASLSDTENRIQYARRYYNGAVRILNTRVQSFPYLLIADPLGFQRAEFFAIEDDERRAPQVQLD